MKFSELDAKHRLLVLRAAYEAVNLAVLTQVKNVTGRSYLEFFANGKSFTIEDIWAGIRHPQNKHFQRSGEIISYLEDLIEKTEAEIAPVKTIVNNDESEPVVKPPKKSRKKGS